MDLINKFGGFVLRSLFLSGDIAYAIEEASDDYRLLEKSLSKPRWNRSQFDRHMIQVSRDKYQRGNRPTFPYSSARKKQRQQYDDCFKNIIHMLEEFY